ALRWPEPRGLFAPKDDPARNLWFVRDHLAMAQAKGWGQVAPFYLELETSTGPLPRAGRLTPTLRNDHLQYALTWDGLAIVLAAVVALWHRSRWHDGRQEMSWGRRDEPFSIQSNLPRRASNPRASNHQMRTRSSGLR